MVSCGQDEVYGGHFHEGSEVLYLAEIAILVLTSTRWNEARCGAQIKLLRQPRPAKKPSPVEDPATTTDPAALVPLALFDLDFTLLDGDCEWLWSQFIAEQGVVGNDFTARIPTFSRITRPGRWISSLTRLSCCSLSPVSIWIR